jgi:prepilin-type N-terminal cleavage/methylation domain-containing protein
MRGVTLLELVVALAVAGLSLGVAALAVRILKPQAETAALGELREVRERAIISGRPQPFATSRDTVWFRPDGSATGGPVVLDSVVVFVDGVTGELNVAAR